MANKSQEQAQSSEQQEQKSQKEGIQEISLSLPIEDLEVLCEMIVDFDNLKANGYDLIGDVKTLGWEKFFNRLKGPVYPELVKKFWIHATISKLQISLYVMGKKF